MKRYLLVDDNAALAENLAEILRDGGDEVTVAESGARALALAAGSKFDAMITDMRMPVMNGAVLLHEIRRVDPGLPVVVITAYTGESDLLAAREQGLLAVLPKPVPIDRLVSLLTTARRDGLVALVEDDVALAENLSEALRERGFSAVTARSVTETDRRGDVSPFAALVDRRVPGGPDGAALQRLLERNPKLPVVVMSGYADSIAQAAWPLTFEKPFQTARLLEAVEKLWR